MTQEAIPQHLDDLSADWLTGALRGRGHLADARVAQVRREPLGDGAGFLGAIARLHLGFEGDSGDLPATLIAKLPTPIPENRTLAELLGAYWREIHFYEELGHRVPIRTPALFHADLTPDPMRARQDRLVGWMNKLPGRVLDWSLGLSERVVRTDHRYVLLLEDLAPARVGDQVAGGTPSACAMTLRAVARMHATFWQDPALEEPFWLSDQLVTSRMRHRLYLAARESFEAQYEVLLSAGFREYVEWVDRFGEKLTLALNRGAPRTLIHGDLRLDNVFFSELDGTGGDRGDPVILADWQLAGRGPAGYDVAYLLSGSLDADVPEATVQELLREYHALLLEQGVAHSFDALTRDYQRGLLSMVQTLATIDTVDMGEARGAELSTAWLERCFARLRAVDPATVL